MRFIFSYENSIIVHNVRNLLANAGIKTQLKNEFSSSAAGDLAPHDTWCELYLCDADDYDKAKKLIESFQSQVVSDECWQCDSCEAKNPENFELCWSCQQYR